MNLEGDQATVASRWLLYHGTSSYRLKQILRENRLRPSQTGTQKISLTPERSVAEYFACNAVFGDRHDRPQEETKPVLLVLDGEGLIALLYDLEDYTGDGEDCDWENEIACYSDIEPLDEVLIRVEPVSEDRAKPYAELPLYEQRRDAYKPVGPGLSAHELSSVTQMVEQLEEGQITEDEADQIAAVISKSTLLVRSGAGPSGGSKLVPYGGPCPSGPARQTPRMVDGFTDWMSDPRASLARSIT